MQGSVFSTKKAPNETRFYNRRKCSERELLLLLKRFLSQYIIPSPFKQMIITRLSGFSYYLLFHALPKANLHLIQAPNLATRERH